MKRKKFDEECLQALGLTKDEFSSLEQKMFAKMKEKEPKSILPYLIGKYLGQNNSLGDLAKFCVENGGVGPYIRDGLEPNDFFDYIARVCPNNQYKNALELLRKKYNEIANSTYTLFKVRGEDSYEYNWYVCYNKHSIIGKYYYYGLVDLDKNNK